MNAKFPFLTRLLGRWEDVQQALVDGLDQMGSSIQSSYGKFSTDITLPAGKLTYANGVWTPVDTSPAKLVLSQAFTEPARYVRLGRLVLINAAVKYPATADVNNATISVPFTVYGDQSSNGGNYIRYPIAIGYTDLGATLSCDVENFPTGFSSVVLRDLATGALKTNAQMSGKTVIFGGMYETSAS